MNIAIIPARGGSKRILKKNIRPFCGRPIISYSIETALKCNLFDRVIVSTDDPETARISGEAGAEIPFLRPAEISDDYSGLIPVIRHSIEWLTENQKLNFNICCILATAPFIQSEDLKLGMNLHKRSNPDFVLSVTRFPYSIQRALKLNTDGMLEMVQPENYSVRSQDLEENWHDAAQFYIGSYLSWMEAQSLFSNAMPVEIPKYRVVDIDTLDDWNRAELLYKAIYS